MKILIIKLSSLGDLFHALPAVHNLKVELNTKIDWVVNKKYVDVVKCFTDVDNVIPFYRNAFFANFKPFLKELRAQEYDYIIDLQGLMKSAIVGKLARGSKLIGPSFHRECAHLFYSGVAGKCDKNRHAVEENLDIVRYLGLNLMEPEFHAAFPKKNLSEKHPRVAILPVSRWHTKNWHVKNFIDVAGYLQGKKNISIFILGSPEDVEICKGIETALNGDVINMAGKTSLVDMAGILNEMDLLIANDSGPTHMAAAVGTPVLAVFGPTDPARTGPYGSRHRIAEISLPCRPCFSKTCGRGNIQCMAGVTAEQVEKTALEMIQHFNNC